MLAYHPIIRHTYFMPELPEVETVKRGLSRLIIGKKIADVSFDWPKSFPNASGDVENFLVGAQIKSVARRGKALKIDLSTGYTVVIHLKMTGQLIHVDSKQRFGAGHPSDSLVAKLPDKSTRVTFSFVGGSKLYFNDQRKFGWVRLIPTIEVDEIDFFKKIGPEPLSKALTEQEFIKRLDRRKNTSIKAALLDQTVIAGIGNIYADEALWGSKIHPASLVKNISAARKKLLLKSIRQVLRLAIKSGGSTDRNYRDAEGKMGSYLTFAKVFRREGQACPRCHGEIVKTRVAGRGTHLCINCQRPDTAAK